MPDQPEPTGDTPGGDNHIEQPPRVDDLIAGLPDENMRRSIQSHIASLQGQVRSRAAKLSELGPKAAKYDEVTEAAKSEQQRATEQLTRLERERDDAKAALLRYDVAATIPGLQASDAAFLTGSNREELEASAQRLLARIQAAGQPPAPTLPAPDKAQGRDGQGGTPDAESWLRGALHH